LVSIVIIQARYLSWILYLLLRQGSKKTAIAFVYKQVSIFRLTAHNHITPLQLGGVSVKLVKKHVEQNIDWLLASCFCWSTVNPSLQPSFTSAVIGDAPKAAKQWALQNRRAHEPSLLLAQDRSYELVVYAQMG
jgi:hypothetical protein